MNACRPRLGRTRPLPCLVLVLAIAGLSLPATLAAQPVAGARASSPGARAAKSSSKAKCPAKSKSHAKQAKPAKKCPSKHKRGKRKKAEPKKTTSGGSPSSQRTLTASAVSLKPEEQTIFEAVNRKRSEHGVAALATSAELQAIAEARAKQTVEELATKGAVSIDDVRVSIEDAGYCATSQREVENGGQSRAASQEQEEKQHKVEELTKHPLPPAGEAQSVTLHGMPLVAGLPSIALATSIDSNETIEEREIAEEEAIPLEAKWKLLAVATAEAGAWAVELEDFAEPC